MMATIISNVRPIATKKGSKTSEEQNISVAVPSNLEPAKVNNSTDSGVDAHSIHTLSNAEMQGDGKENDLEMSITNGKDEEIVKLPDFSTTLTDDHAISRNHAIDSMEAIDQSSWPAPIASNELIDLTGVGDAKCSNTLIEEMSDDTECENRIDFDFDTTSPRVSNKVHTSISSEDAGIESESGDESSNDSSSLFSAKSNHDHNGCCKNVKSTLDDDFENTFENDELEWTASCAVIDACLPPSFSGSYLYVRDKMHAEDVMYIPGVSIVNLPREQQRGPEIYLCAVKCAKANSLNFLYCKIDDVEAYFAGMRITISIKT